MAKVSFNQWIKMQVDQPSALGDFAAAWVVGRGRLTRASVGRTALALHFESSVGEYAYDSYLKAIGATAESTAHALVDLARQADALVDLTLMDLICEA